MPKRSKRGMARKDPQKKEITLDVVLNHCTPSRVIPLRSWVQSLGNLAFYRLDEIFQVDKIRIASVGIHFLPTFTLYNYRNLLEDFVCYGDFTLYIGITSLYLKNITTFFLLQDGMLHKKRHLFLCNLQIYTAGEQALLTFPKLFDIVIVLGPSIDAPFLLFAAVPRSCTKNIFL